VPVNYIPHPIRAIINDVLVVPGRAYATIYQNTTLRPLFVLITNQHSAIAGGDQARAVAYIDPTSPPATPCAYSGWLASPAGGTLHGYFYFVVPPGWYYQVLSGVAGGGANALNEWFEVNV